MSAWVAFQGELFFWTLFWGAGLMLSYDVICIFRMLIPHKKVWENVEDLLFWLGAGLFIFTLLYRYNEGRVRNFCILGMGLGMLFYQYTISPFILKGISKGCRFLREMLQKFKLFINHR